MSSDSRQILPVYGVGAAADRDAPRRLNLAERAAHSGERPRDCRSCKAFVPGSGGLGYGWCRAFAMNVKLYHPAGGSFFSQCQFKVLTRVVTVADQPEGAAVSQ